LRSAGFSRTLSVMDSARVPRILVVDDEPPLVDLVRGYLEREGFAVLNAGDGNGDAERRLT